MAKQKHQIKKSRIAIFITICLIAPALSFYLGAALGILLVQLLNPSLDFEYWYGFSLYVSMIISLATFGLAYVVGIVCLIFYIRGKQKVRRISYWVAVSFMSIAFVLSVGIYAVVNYNGSGLYTHAGPIFTGIKDIPPGVERGSIHR